MTNAGYICTKAPDKTQSRKKCMNFILPYELDDVSLYKCYIHIREHGVPYPEVLFVRYLREHSDIVHQIFCLLRELLIKLIQRQCCYYTHYNTYKIHQTVSNGNRKACKRNNHNSCRNYHAYDCVECHRIMMFEQ